MKELIERVEQQILETPTGELRDLLCDVNIMLQLKDAANGHELVHLDARTIDATKIAMIQRQARRGVSIIVIGNQACSNTMTIEESIQKDNSSLISEPVDLTPYQYTREELLDNKPHKHKNKRPYHK